MRREKIYAFVSFSFSILSSVVTLLSAFRKHQINNHSTEKKEYNDYNIMITTVDRLARRL